ncbi:hypothetical protein RI367_007378 [Sorochytrium milnesiophthora]
MADASGATLPNDTVLTMPNTNGHGPAVASARRRHPQGWQGAAKSYLRVYGADWLGILLMGALGLGIYYCRPVPNRLFPLQFQDGEVVYPQFAYPLRRNIIPIWLAGFLGFIFSFVAICLVQIRVRSWHDFNTALLGLLSSLVTAAVFQVFLKWLIGGLRPHFYAVCKPDTSGLNVGQGYQSLMVDRSVCTGDEKQINDALESFPSGHSTAAFAGLVYLSLYLNGKLKVFSNMHPAYWKFVLFFAPLLAATLIAGTLTIDEFHNWYDVVAGGIIGTLHAVAAYRFGYASLWDWRINHIPLSRNAEWETTISPPAAAEMAYATRQGPWADPSFVKPSGEEDRRFI